jgi:hypothetical protein
MPGKAENSSDSFYSQVIRKVVPLLRQWIKRHQGRGIPNQLGIEATLVTAFVCTHTTIMSYTCGL